MAASPPTGSPSVPVEELEADIFNLESSATHMWELDVEGKGTRADLSMATHREDGDAFSGFGDHDDGVWIAALICTACQNPTPMLISVLEPE